GGGAEVREDLVPAVVRKGSRRLCEITEDRQRAVGGAARDHAQLHRGQVLRLVDDDVPEPARRAVDQRPCLVQEWQVVLAPDELGRASGPIAEQDLLRLWLKDP